MDEDENYEGGEDESFSVFDLQLLLKSKESQLVVC